jgi:hypothetical protein
MVVEVYIRNNSTPEASLPDSILELESMLGEARLSFEKLKESTDVLTEECRKAENEDEAKEFYNYVQENLSILEAKSTLINEIERKIAQMRGVFPKLATHPNVSHSAPECPGSGHFV